LQAFSGAKVLGNITSLKSAKLIDSNLLGYIKSIYVKSMYCKKYVILEYLKDRPDKTNPRKNISTLFVTAYSEFQCHELKSAYETVNNILPCISI